MIGPGQIGIFHAAGGQIIVSEHFYDGAEGGAPTLNLLELRFDGSGWPIFQSDRTRVSELSTVPAS